MRSRQEYLHQAEAPTALLTSLFANANRDPKKQKKPFKMEDFFLYQPKENSDTPTSIYGAAAMRLLEKGLFPRWGLFVYKDLKESASGNPPSLLAFLHENAVLLAPVINESSVRGMLICEDRAHEKTIEMVSPCGQSITVKIPKFNGRYSAIENIELDVTH